MVKNNKITGSTGDNIDNFPITREDPKDIELLLDEWEKGKIHTRFTREELKRRIIKLEDFKYQLDIPVEAITDESIKFIIAIRPSLFDPTKELENKENA